MTAGPRVSVVIAAYRAEGFVAGAVASALAQTLADIEVIVVDDASGDGTLAAAEAAASGDSRLKTIRLKQNGGPSAARNAGFAAATGTWIAVLDADDAMAPERLAKLVAFAEASRADIVADALTVEEDGKAAKTFACTLGSPVKLADYARDNRMFRKSGGSGYLKPMFRRTFVREHGLAYDPALRIAEDWTFVADALAHGATFALMQEPLYRYRVHAGSISARLSVAKLAPLIASADAFLKRHAARLTEDEKQALGERRATLADALAYQGFLDKAKGRDLVGAAGSIAVRPTAWPLLWQPIAARLSGTRGKRETFG